MFVNSNTKLRRLNWAGFRIQLAGMETPELFVTFGTKQECRLIISIDKANGRFTKMKQYRLFSCCIPCLQKTQTKTCLCCSLPFLLYDKLKSSSFLNYFPENVLLKSKLLLVFMLMKVLNIHKGFLWLKGKHDHFFLLSFLKHLWEWEKMYCMLNFGAKIQWRGWHIVLSMKHSLSQRDQNTQYFRKSTG